MRFVKPGPRRRPQSGLTLVELMVAVSIAALLGMAAMPQFAEYTTNARLRESGNVLLAEALAVQSEAIKLNRTLRLAGNGNSMRVLDRTNPDAPAVLRERTLPAGVSAGTATIDFGSEGRPVPFGTAGAIDISMTGITCSGDLRCPGLRVDAGGAIRLCGERLTLCD